jgi:DNA-binding NarL/FixJ family response regulator
MGVPTVVLADRMAGTDVVDALTIGARGLLPRHARLPVLFDCLRAVAEGAFWVGHERVRDVVDAFRRVREARSPAPAGAVTPRDPSLARAGWGAAPPLSRRRAVTPAP